MEIYTESIHSDCKSILEEFPVTGSLWLKYFHWIEIYT